MRHLVRPLVARSLRPFASSLQLRLLATLVLAVAAALGTVAVVADLSTALEFERYVERNRADMQSVAEQIAARTGDRLLVANTQGQVILDSSGELLGQTVSPERAEALRASVAGSRSSVDVLFIRRPSPPMDGVGLPMPPDVPVWTRPLDGPALAQGPMFGVAASLEPPPLFDREQVFVNAVSRSLMLGVLVGGGVAIGLAVAFSRRILRPIGALTTAARRLERGELDQRVVVHGSDEIGQLGHAFNAMADGLARTERLRRTMVTDVAHELRTPLTNLRGYLEALREGVAQPRPEVIDSLYEETMLLNQLVDDLQDLTLSEAGQLELRREPTDLPALLTAVAQALRPQVEARKICLDVDWPADLPRVDLDPKRVGQVLRNLLANALRYTPEGGRIRLDVRQESERVVVRVQDTGPGIPAEHLNNVFERFYRVDASRTRGTGGSGIGLSVVKQLVEAHGGRVAVDSAPGRGATFTFTLPTAAHCFEAPPAPVRP
jgi:signal transduction histidine kinase